MKKTRRRYDREFKLSVVSELEGGKPPAQIAHERGPHSPHLTTPARLLHFRSALVSSPAGCQARVKLMPPDFWQRSLCPRWCIFPAAPAAERPAAGRLPPLDYLRHQSPAASCQALPELQPCIWEALSGHKWRGAVVCSPLKL
jgi:hypothetical protein